MKKWISICAWMLLLGCAVGLVAMAMADGRAIPAIAQQNDRVTRFLLMGCDKSTKLTDSILLVTVNESAGQTSILQIPRDTYAEYTKRDYKKLNGAMNTLGADGFKCFLSEALGVKIHYFVVLKLDFFRALIDDIGGVTVEIPQDMTYSDPEQGLEINLKKGKMHLDGAGAEQFVRYRSGYVNADLGRLDAQKSFLRAFAAQCKTLSWRSILRVLGHALTGVQTDLGVIDAVRVLKVLLACDPDTVPMATLAGQAVQGRSGAWYYVLNREGASEQIQEYLQPATANRFDAAGLFESDTNSDFKRIYRAPRASLPIRFDG